MHRGLSALVGLVLVFAQPAAAAFPGKNGRIAFMCGENHSELCTMAPDGTRIRLLKGLFENPAWSPGGRRLAFNDTPGFGSRLYVARPDGSARRELLDFGLTPAWSPSGRAIAFQGLSRRLGVVRLRDGRTRELTIPPADSFDSDPAWSPDGRLVAFARTRFERKCSEPDEPPYPGAPGPVCGTFPTRSDLYLVRSDGTGERILVQGEEVPYVLFNHAPAWSPDGRRLVFAHAGGLAVIRRDGSGLRDLGVNGAEPAWSPDGRWIAYTGLDDGYLHLVGTGGDRRKRLCFGRSADWQPLGRRVGLPRRGGPRCDL